MSNSYKVYASQEYVDNKIQEIDTSVDWNAKEGEPGYIKNRTHYAVFENISCVIDQDFFLSFNGEKFTVIAQGDDGNPATLDFCRISDRTPSQESFEKAHIVVTDSSGETIYNIENFELSNSIGEDYVYHITYRRGGYTSSFPIACFQTAGTKVGLFEDSSSVNVPAPGVYVPPIISVTMVKDVVTIDFESETYKKLNPKFLPETVVIAEPPVIGESSLIILPETALESDPDDQASFALPITSIPEVGKVYTVNYNGTPYDCTLVDLGELDPGVSVYVMGNITATFPPESGMISDEVASADNPDAPFLIGIAVSDGQLLDPAIIALDGATAVTLSISCGSSPVPMQLVTDINGTPIWEERTHWDDLSIIVPKGDYPGDLDGTYIFNPPTHPIEEGRVYTVELEGVIFETTFTRGYSDIHGETYASEEYRDDQNRHFQISLFPYGSKSLGPIYGIASVASFGGTGSTTDGTFKQNLYIHAGSIKTLEPKYLAAVPNKSKTTIFPKTTLTVSDPNDPGDGAQITTPFAEYPSAGDIWNITYNGIEYACEFIDASITSDTELPFPEGALYVGGNLTAAGFEHAASNNDAPFLIMAVGSEEFVAAMESYGAIMPIVTLDQTFTVSITKDSQMVPQQLTLRSNGEMVWEEWPFYEIEGQGTLEVNLSTVQGANISFSPYIPNTVNGAWPLIADFVPSLESFKKANITITDASGVKPITDRLVFQIGDDYIYNIVYDNGDENESPYIGFVVCSTAGDKTELIKQIYPSCERAEVSVPGIYVEPWSFILEASTSVTVDFGTHIIKTIEPKFLPETVVQAEPLAKGEVILEETALEIVEVNPGEHEILLTTPWKQDLVAGRAYTVTYNGQAYVCKAVSFAEIQPGAFDSAIILGNLSAANVEHSGSNSNAPFAMLAIPNAFAASEGVYGMFIPLDDSTEMIISVSSGSGGTPQWLVADSDSNIKWEERTHWVEKAKGESFGTIEKLNVVGDYAYSGPGTSYYGAFSPFSYRPDFLNVKELYIVLDGQEYYSKAISNGFSTVFGNEEIAELSFGNKNFTAPFAGILLPGNPEVASGEYGAVQLIMPEDTEPVEHTVEVYSVGEYVHKLDPKFIDLSAIETEQFWYPTLRPETPAVLYENNNITLSYQDLYGNGRYTYNADTINIGLNTVNFNYRKLYTLVADGEEFIASVSRSPSDMDIGNTNVIMANNPATGHSIIAYCPPSGTGVMHFLLSNFDFTSLVIKDAYSVTYKIPGQLVEGTTALDYGTGFGSIVSAHGGAVAGDSSFAFGNETKANGTYSFAFGLRNTVKGNNSFAFGPYLYVKDDNQFTVGRNAARTNDNKYPFVVANGYSMAEDGGKNIHALAWTGDAYHTGDVYVQGDGTTAGFDGAKKVATEEFVTEAVNAALAALGLPIPTTADAGKILRVNAEGKYELVSP